jgi:hypothetical protein
MGEAARDVGTALLTAVSPSAAAWHAGGTRLPGQLGSTPKRLAPKVRGKQRLLAKLAKQEAGQLGLTEAEKRQKVGTAQKEAAQQTAAFSRGIQRQALAAGTGFGGMQAEMTRDIAGQAAEAGAKSAADTERLSAQLAQMEAADIDTQLKYQLALKRGTAKHWAKMGVDTGAAIAQASANLAADVV